MDKQQKEKIARLFQTWRDRSTLTINQILARIQQQPGCNDFTRPMLENRFIRLDTATDISPAQTVAVITAFTQCLSIEERCTAAEALTLADLTRLPLSQIEHLCSLFPAQEFETALQQHLPTLAPERLAPHPLAITIDVKPVAQINRAGGDTPAKLESFMPLYPKDKIYTQSDGAVTYVCRQNQLVMHIPAGRIAPVNCYNEQNEYAVGQVEQLVSPRPQRLPMALSKTAQEYLLAVNHRQTGQFEQAAQQFETLACANASAWLWLHAAAMHAHIRNYTQAAVAWQTALTAADDEQAKTIACIGLSVIAYAQTNPAQALTHLQNAPTVTPSTPALQAIYSAALPPLTLADYARLLAGQIAPHLRSRLQTIPNSFLETLEKQREQLALKFNAPATAGLGPNLEAMELLAATYLVTLTLLENQPDGVTPQTDALRQHVQQTAQTAIGLSPGRAQQFATDYATAVEQNLAALQKLR